MKVLNLANLAKALTFCNYEQTKVLWLVKKKILDLQLFKLYRPVLRIFNNGQKLMFIDFTFKYQFEKYAY